MSMLFVASCGGDAYDDTALRNDLTDLANRVAKLEQLCQQMNTNISSLQTIVNALQQNDFVTAVVPVTQGGKVIGYTITFSRSGAITIYHGTDGKNGENGKDGSTPQIGVKKDSDGIYYWTLNGEWLLDANGNKIQAEGKDGADGANGSSGVDGVTPQLKIEEGYWYISYDNGSTWTQLGKAVGEDGADGNDGIDGSDGQDGDSIFSKVTQDEECVYFYLSDGTMITLPKHDKENIQFEDLNVKAICCTNWDTNYDGELSYAEAAAVTDIGTIFKGNTMIIAFNELKYFTGLAAIAEHAFEQCTNLWKIELPNSINAIEDRAFYNCESIVSVKIPESVLSINDEAFAECENLRNLTIGQNVVSIGHDAFYWCKSLRNVIIPASVKEIGSYAFGSCYLAWVELNEGLEIIGEGAFSYSTFTTITIPSTVKKVGCHLCGSYEKPTLISVYCKPITPPTISPIISTSGPFYRSAKFSNGKIYVPKESLSAYMSHKEWSMYQSHYVGYDFDEDPNNINNL